MNKNTKINKNSIYRDSFLISFIFTNIIFIGMFLVFFINSNDLFVSIKKSFLLALFIFIAIAVVVFIFLDAQITDRLNEVEDFNNSFDTGKQNEIELKQKNLLNKVSQYKSKDSNNANLESNNSSSKTSNFNAKTQFNPDFETNVDDLSSKMDV